MSPLILTLLLAAAAPDVTVGTLDGDTTVGRLTALSAGQLTLETADGLRTIAADQLLSLTPADPATPAEEKPAVWIELVDGSKLTGSRFTATGGVASVAAGPVHFEFPTAAIRAVRFSSPDNPSSSWHAEVGAQAAGDLLAVRKKDAVDFLAGVLGDVSDNLVEFRVDDDTISVKRSKVDGLVYYHKPGDELADPVCVIESPSDWRLKAKDVSLAEGMVNVATQAGPAFRLPWDAVAHIDFSAGKVIYLSDLEPQSVDWTPLIPLGESASVAQFYGPRRDASRESQPLRLADQSYSKGLSLSSRTEVVYRLPPGAKKFKAVAGIDDLAGDIGHVRLRISADRKTLLDVPIAGSDSPLPLDLDVAGARRLTILVDYGDDLDIGDQLDLADARILK